MRVFRHCTVAILALSIGQPALGQTAVPEPAPGEATFAIFMGGRDVGREQVNVARASSNWIITSTGRVGDTVINRFEVKYSADWQPTELRLEITQKQRQLLIATSFGVTTAINEITQDGKTTAKTDQVSARTIVLPNVFIGAYEALAARLAAAQTGAELPIYVAPQAEVKLTVNSSTTESLQTPSGPVVTRRFGITVQNPGGPLTGTIVIDTRGRLVRVEIPGAGLTAVRTDLSSVAVRPITARNPTDADVTVPGNGFSLAGTMTKPAAVGRLRHPTVVLVAGSGSGDRDATVAGIPIFSQIAGALASRGYLVLRYDKRGIGQSGGRVESAGLQDYAEDLVSVVKWLAKRDDVDSKRITVLGHGEGGAVALLAAAREGKIGSLVLAATPGVSGAELVLEQQQHQFEVMKLPDAQRQEKTALQKRIQEAVVTGKGWEELPPELRQQADTAWFRSILEFDPAKVMTRVKQPILVVQGDLDTQVPPHQAEKLGALARGRKKAAPVEVVHVPGVNHLLVEATTGEVQEYPTLAGRNVSATVITTISDWLAKPPSPR
jgi:pimeloyl-ACP methyl ester carboxylesterase